MRKLTRVFRPIYDWGYLLGLTIVLLGLGKCLYHLVADPSPISAVTLNANSGAPIGVITGWLVSTVPDFVMLGVMSVIVGFSIMVLRVYERES